MVRVWSSLCAWAFFILWMFDLRVMLLEHTNPYESCSGLIQSNQLLNTAIHNEGAGPTLCEKL